MRTACMPLHVPRSASCTPAPPRARRKHPSSCGAPPASLHRSNHAPLLPPTRPPTHPPACPPARLPTRLPAGKFIFLYKRAAHRVVLSLTGDLIVRPSCIELSAREHFNTSLQQHLLGCYGRRWVRVRVGSCFVWGWGRVGGSQHILHLNTHRSSAPTQPNPMQCNTSVQLWGAHQGPVPAGEGAQWGAARLPGPAAVRVSACVAGQ